MEVFFVVSWRTPDRGSSCGERISGEARCAVNPNRQWEQSGTHDRPRRTRIPRCLREESMIRSEKRIHTTHAGALPRDPELRDLIFARAEGKPYDRGALSTRLRSEVAAIVRRQAECGVDSVNDGELGKTNFTNYVRERLAGFEMRDYRHGVDPAPLNITARDSKDFPQYFAGGRGALTGAAQRKQLAVCV